MTPRNPRIWLELRNNVGRDAGELIGAGPIGINVTAAVNEMISMKTDALVFNALGDISDQ